MKTCTIRRRIEKKHLDAGKHASWIAQFEIAGEAHDTLREQIGIGLKTLINEHDLFLLMRWIRNVKYKRQINLGTEVEITTTVTVFDETGLRFSNVFKVDGKVVTLMNWDMPLITFSTGALTPLPAWMIEAVGDIPKSAEQP